MKTLFLILLALVPIVALTQPLPDTLWVRTYPELGEVSPYQIRATDDGGLVLTGWRGSQPPPGEDGYMSMKVIRLDADGNVVWNYEYPSSLEHWSYGRGLVMTPEGDIIAYGGRHTGGGSQDGQNALVLRISADGELVWACEYDLNWYEFGYCIEPTLDGNYIIGTGSSSYEHWLSGCLLKINGEGDSLWAHCYESDIYAEHIACAPDSGFMVAGRAGGGPTTVGVIRTDKHGNALWEWPYEYYNGPVGIATDADSNFVIAGDGPWDPFVFKIDSEGWEQWNYSYAPPAGEYETWSNMVPTGNGGFLIAAHHFTDTPGVESVHVLEINGQGETQWEVFKDVGDYVYLRSICSAPDGGFAVAGGRIPGADPSAGMLLVARFGPPSQSAGPSDVTPLSFSLAQNYPNPFNPTTSIGFTLPHDAHTKLEIFNSLGQKVATLVDGNLTAGAHTVTWEATNAPSGQYIYQLTAGEFNKTRRMMLVK